MKRIIHGQAYNTDTATELFCLGPSESDAWYGLYQTRHGVFFKVVVDHDGETVLEFGPLSEEQALQEVGKHQPHLVDQYFGPFPEGGAAERRWSIRLPASLAERVEAAARQKSLSVNSYTMRCLEVSTTADGQPRKDT